MSSFHYECTELNVQVPTDYYGRFHFPKLEIGQGITIGNILRRVLLYSLTGIAIVGVRVAGVNNEFGTIAGVREDVLELILNLKEVVFQRVEGANPFLDWQQPIGRLRVRGPGIVSASSISLPANLRVVNPSQYLATIAEEVTFEFEAYLEFGRGYTLAENKPVLKPQSVVPLDLMEVDAVFMPVKRVSFEVDTRFSETEGGYETLQLDIWTNGSLTPGEALFQATKTVVEWFSQVHQVEPSELVEPTQPPEISSVQAQDHVNQVKIEQLNLSTRAYNSLKKANIHTIGDLRTYTLGELKKLKSFGQKSMDEVQQTLQATYGIILE